MRALILVLLVARPAIAQDPALEGTFSIIARDPATGELGMAVQSKTLAVGLQVFVQQNRAEWGHLAAASVLVAIPAVIVFYLVQRFLVSGLSAGSVKG